MTTKGQTDLDNYFETVMTTGKLRSIEHAHLWSDAVLKTLGFHLNRNTKRALAKALPEELADPLKNIFWLLHFRDPELSLKDFQKQAARRSGNSNSEFAYHPVRAVFAELKRFTNSDLDQQVAEALSPEVRELWLQAQAEAVAG